MLSYTAKLDHHIQISFVFSAEYLNKTIAILLKTKDEIAQIQIRNRWDAYKVMVIEPDVNSNNIIIDVLLTNLTTHFETILNEINCETNNRRLPNFATSKSRAKRSIIGNMLKKAFKTGGKFLGWTVALTTAGTIGSSSAVWLDHYMSRNDYIFMKQQELSCHSFNYGCHEGLHLCWSNCGPRKNSADWCFTKNASTNSSQSTPYGVVHKGKLCNYNRDCNSCDLCASECFEEN